jgi:hypothetical protein
MHKTKRQHDRTPVNYDVVFYWEEAGQVKSARPRARDASDFGMRVDSAVNIERGTEVCVEAAAYGSPITAVVRYCIPEGTLFRIGIQFSSSAHQSSQSVNAGTDYYEILQLSQKADMETIHRVYRIMAARFHPDNPNGGDQERFLLLSEAYRVLSDPARRAQYDLLKSTDRPSPVPLFQARAFVDEKEGELNRRLGVLCLLYAQRRRSPDHPAIALIELEGLMSIPREYLEFTLWYLKQKKYVEMNEGADFSLTATGVDFVEDHTLAREILLRLLSGDETKCESEPQYQEAAVHHAPSQLQ